MTANESTTGRTGPHSLPSRPSHARMTVAWLLGAALVVQLAAWISAALATPNLGSAFTKPHAGFPAEVIPGGAIWLVQFAAVVIVFFWRARSRKAA
ncbi:MAG TPA: hypothetical protein VMC83_05135 [Streptosporangiaceae bacterium]|nr:hypothetical protein [Streptosporangiaceae bacterium]